LIIFFLPFNAFANNFAHISTWGYNLWDLTGDLEQAKWLAKRHDWYWGGGGKLNETLYDAVKSVNPNIKLIPYIAYNTYELVYQDWIKSWCERNGYNFEDTFYHYYYDTVVKLRGSNPSQILIKGYGGGSAKTLQEARVPSSWAQYNNGGFNPVTGLVIRLNINPTSKVWRLGYQAWILENRIKINASKGKYADGIELDTFDGTVYDASDLQLERTIEMRNLGKYTRAEANAQASNDLISAMKELGTYLTNQTGRPILTIPNTGDVDSFYEWRKFLYADRVSDYSHVMVEYMTRAGSGTYRIKRLQQIYDTMVNNGLIIFARNETSILVVSEKVNQFLIAGHYLINHPKYILMYHRGSPSFYGGSPGGQLYTTHWHKNLEYDVGKPVERSGQDYWGQTNTDRFFIFASVTNNSDSLKNYTIVGREYTNALVLAKFGAKGFVANAGNNPTTHDLNGTYRLLQPDNSLGPPITEITFGDSEGAILIKQQQTVLPTPPPTITPTPTPEPTPTPTPVPEPTPTPTPTRRENKPRVKRDKLVGGAQIYLAASEMTGSGLPIGNIKSYEVSTANASNTLNTSNIPNVSTGVQVLDSTKTPALDSNNLLKDSSKSSWSSGADGNKVDKGGVGEVLLKREKARNIFTNLKDPNLMSESNEFATSNEKITPELLGFAQGDTVQRDKLIQFIQGYDAYSKVKGKSASEKRKWILGAIVNSRPLVIPYGNSRSVIFAGANDGIFHAFDNATGEELWGFIPDELLNRLKNLTSGNKLEYFVDGSPKAYITESQKIIIFGLRRGGSNYYALDVTDPENPKFLWEIGPETTGFSEMGQTWSTPQIGKIKYGSGEKVVCFIGGGYDENQDKKSLKSDDKKGRGVYIVDLFTGQQVWRWDFARDPNMKYSIPSDISCVDTNGDGYIDRLYVGDMGGKLWRFDLKGSDPNGWSGSTLFNSSAGLLGGSRKIFSRPDVTLEKDFEMVFFGTGDREHSDETKVTNQIFAIKDKGLNSTLSERDLENVTDGVNDLKGIEGKEGWFMSLENKGEKALAPPVVVFGVAYFTTFAPEGSEGIARIYALDYKNGGPIIDLNAENNTEGRKIDLSDRSRIIGTGIPSGVVFSAINGKPFGYAGFQGGVYNTPLKRNSTIIPIWWREVSKK